MSLLGGMYSRVLYHAGLLRRPGLVIFMYHGVIRSPLPFYDCCFVDATEFARQIAYIKRHFDVMPLSTALAHLRGGTITRPVAAITLDDGFQSSYTIAFPILRTVGVPATISVVTGLVNTNTTFWFCRLHQALAESAKSCLDWQGKRYDILDAYQKTHAFSAIGEKLKQLPQPQLQQKLHSIIVQLGIDPDHKIGVNSPFRVLSESEIQEMAASGLIEFGAHTHSHAILSLLPREECREEIERSVSRVAEITGKPCRVFAYPNGGIEDYNGTAMRILSEAGVRAGLTALAGVNHQETPELELRRYGVAANLNFDRFRQSLQRIILRDMAAASVTC